MGIRLAAIPAIFSMSLLVTPAQAAPIEFWICLYLGGGAQECADIFMGLPVANASEIGKIVERFRAEHTGRKISKADVAELMKLVDRAEKRK